MRNIFFGKISFNFVLVKKKKFLLLSKQKYNFKFQICYYVVNLEKKSFKVGEWATRWQPRNADLELYGRVLPRRICSDCTASVSVYSKIISPPYRFLRNSRSSGLSIHKWKNDCGYWIPLLSNESTFVIFYLLLFF